MLSLNFIPAPACEQDRRVTKTLNTGNTLGRCLNLSKSSLEKESILNFLSNSLQETPYLTSVMLIQLFFLVLNAFLLFTEFCQNITPYIKE
jgi:hypothetical protein